MTIETERLILRSPRPGDAEPMFRNWASDPEVTKFLSWPAHSDIGVSQWVIDSWIKEEEGGEGILQLMIVPRELGEPIGTISIVRFDREMGIAELGYCIGQQWWHQGITTEALKAVIAYLLASHGISKVTAKHDVNNPHSGGVMRKAGMIFEGISEKGGVNNCGVCDVARYTIAR